MMNQLAKILSINPLLSLSLVVGYLAFLWWITMSVWTAGYKVGAVLFMITMSLTVMSKSKGLIEKIKSIKEDNLNT
jgi:hypothetical protein